MTAVLPPGRWSPPIHAELQRMLADTPASVAAFDFDHTCVRGDMGLATAAWNDDLHGTHLLSDYHRLSAAGDPHQACAQLARGLLQGRTEQQVWDLAQEAFEAARAKGMITIEPEIQHLIDAMHDAGWQVWVVTASPAAVVRPIAAMLGIHPDRVIGFHTHSDGHGVHDAQLFDPWPHGEGKAEALALALTAPLGFAAGDAGQDAAMLRLARHALVIDRGDPDLRAVAEQAGWWVQDGWGGYLKPGPKGYDGVGGC